MHRVGPGTAATADIDVLTLSALTLVCFEVSQIPENLRIFPYLAKGCLLDITCYPMKIGTGLNIAKAVNQADGLCCNAPLTATG